jgi:hypothetical protein
MTDGNETKRKENVENTLNEGQMQRDRWACGLEAKEGQAVDTTSTDFGL